MKTTHLVAFLAICSCAFMVSAFSSVRRPEAGSLLEEYTKTCGRVLNNIEKQATEIREIQSPAPSAVERKAIREVKTKLWFRLLGEIDSYRDADFNFADAPASTVAPPSLTYDSGVDPASITNLVDRQKYEAAIIKNDEKAARYNFQLKLKRMDERFTGLAIEYLQSSYEKTPDEKKLLESIMNGLLSEKRCVEIKKTMGW